MLEELELNQNLKNSIKESEVATEKVNNFLLESRSIYKEVYFQIALVAGATISLSISYVGNLASSTQKIEQPILLILSWFLLGTAMLLGIFRNKAHADMGHWQMSIYRVTKLLKREQDELELVKKSPESYINISNREERENYQSLKTKNVQTYETTLEKLNKKENLASFLWLFVEKTTIMAFILGVGLLIFFASINLINNF